MSSSLSPRNRGSERSVEPVSFTKTAGQSTRDRVKELSISGPSPPGSRKDGIEHFHSPGRVNMCSELSPPSPRRTKMCNELSPPNPLNVEVGSFFSAPIGADNANEEDMDNNALPEHLLVIAPTRDRKSAQKARSKGKQPPRTYQVMLTKYVREFVKNLPPKERKQVFTHLFNSAEKLKREETDSLQQGHREEQRKKRCAGIDKVSLNALWNDAPNTKNPEGLKNAIRVIKEAQFELDLGKQRDEGIYGQTISNKRIKLAMSALTGEGQKNSAPAQPLDEEDLPSVDLGFEPEPELGPELEPAAQAASDPISEALTEALTEALAAEDRAALEIMRNLGYNLKKDGEKYLMDTVKMLAGAGAEAEAGAGAEEDN